MAIPIPRDVRQLLSTPNYVHLSTLRADSSPRNWGGVGGLEDEHLPICTSDAIWKAKDMRRDPRVAMSVTDMANPYRMAAIQGRVVEVRPDQDCRYMDPLSFQVDQRAVSQPQSQIACVSRSRWRRQLNGPRLHPQSASDQNLARWG